MDQSFNSFEINEEILRQLGLSELHLQLISQLTQPIKKWWVCRLTHGIFFWGGEPYTFTSKLVINIQKTNLAFDITLICWLEHTSRLVKFDDSMKQNKFKFSLLTLLT